MELLSFKSHLQLPRQGWVLPTSGQQTAIYHMWSMALGSGTQHRACEGGHPVPAATQLMFQGIGGEAGKSTNSDCPKKSQCCKRK